MKLHYPIHPSRGKSFGQRVLFWVHHPSEPQCADGLPPAFCCVPPSERLLPDAHLRFFAAAGLSWQASKARRLSESMHPYPKRAGHWERTNILRPHCGVVCLRASCIAGGSVFPRRVCIDYGVFLHRPNISRMILSAPFTMPVRISILKIS